MKEHKKAMLISGIIGLGAGLFISGVVLSILLYSANRTQPPTQVEIDEISQGQQMKQEQQPKAASSQVNKIARKPKVADIDLQKTNIEPETIKIEIGPVATAREIATLLEEKGVVSDSDEFITYIISQNSSRTLLHGTKTFALNSDNETALKVLKTYE